MRVLLRLLALGALLAVLPSFADAQRRCVKGRPCGNTCIAVDRTCRIGTPQTAPAATVSTAEPAPTRLAEDTSAAETAETESEAPWVASSRGSTYYRNGCTAGNRLSPANRIYFASEEEAQRVGYRRSRSRGC